MDKRKQADTTVSLVIALSIICMAAFTCGAQSGSSNTLDSMTGCTNPNIGISTSDWGTYDPPVYVPVGQSLQTTGGPLYSSNTIFWTSRENGPGQSILLAGAFTGTSKTVKVALIPAGTIDWQSLVHNKGKDAKSVQLETTGLSFKIPKNFPNGVYGFEINDPASEPVFSLA